MLFILLLTLFIPSSDPITSLLSGISEQGAVDVIVGETAQSSAFSALNGDLSFKCADENIAKVNEAGVITGLSKGTTSVTAYINGLPVYVAKVHCMLSRIKEIAPTSEQLDVKFGEETKLSALLSADVIAAGVMYESENYDVAAANADGSLTFFGVGEAQVKISLTVDPDICSFITVNVTSDKVISIQMNVPYISTIKNSDVAVSVSTYPKGMSLDGVVYISSDEKVATVDQNGDVTTYSTGNATITAVLGDLKSTCLVSVKSKPTLSSLSEITQPRYSKKNGWLVSSEYKETNEASLMFTGDIMSLPSQLRESYANGTYNFDSSFEFIRNILKMSDFAVGNFETVISQDIPLSHQQYRIGSNPNPNCNTVTTFLDAVRYANYDAVVTANNHCCDGGTDGIYSTIEQLDKYKIYHTGTFDQENDRRFMLANINGIKVAIMAYTTFFNSKTSWVDADKRGYMLNPYSESAVKKDVSDAKAAGAEYIIAYNHWGNNNTLILENWQQKYAQQMADAGVDLIVGSHPHYVQQAAYLTASDGRKVLCMYSMGNFLASMSQTYNLDSIILNVKLKKEDGKVSLTEAGFISCRLTTYRDVRFIVVPTSTNLNGGIDSPRMTESASRTRKTLGDVLNEITSLDGYILELEK